MGHFVQTGHGTGPVQSHRQFGDRRAVLQVDEAHRILRIVLQHRHISVDGSDGVQRTIQYVARTAGDQTLHIVFLGNLVECATQFRRDAVARCQSVDAAEFRRINGLAPSDRIPPKLRGAFNQIAKKDDVKRLVTRRTRDVLDRALNSIASIYRDVAVLQNNAEDSVGLINLENRSSITELSVRLNRAGAVTRLDEVAHARKRLAGNGNPLLVFESLFCALIS